jgi:hypothetical protein
LYSISATFKLHHWVWKFCRWKELYSSLHEYAQNCPSVRINLLLCNIKSQY